MVIDLVQLMKCVARESELIEGKQALTLVLRAGYSEN